MASEPIGTEADEAEAAGTSQKRRRSEAIQRLQVGLSGLGAMLLLVSLTNVILDRARQAEQDAVPDNAEDVAGGAVAPASKDPLVDAGVVPQLPAQPVTGPGSGTAGANAPPTSEP